MAYLTVRAASRFTLDPIKGSRFVATVVPVATESEALQAVADVQAELSDARHHCWAFRLHDQDRTRSSDDGEPGGSAGRPILAQIVGHDLQDVCVVVTRWFGGVKLGVGGLIRAYGGCAGKALDAAEVCEAHQWLEVVIQHTYEDTAAVEMVVARHDAQRETAAYDDRVHLTVRVTEDGLDALCAALTESTSGRATVSRPG